jgi:hypothetical protein
MQSIADLIKTHQDTDAVRELYETMVKYEAKFPRTIDNLERSKGTGVIWSAVMLACDDNHEAQG